MYVRAMPMTSSLRPRHRPACCDAQPQPHLDSKEGTPAELLPEFDSWVPRDWPCPEGRGPQGRQRRQNSGAQAGSRCYRPLCDACPRHLPGPASCHRSTPPPPSLAVASSRTTARARRRGPDTRARVCSAVAARPCAAGPLPSLQLEALQGPSWGRLMLWGQQNRGRRQSPASVGTLRETSSTARGEARKQGVQSAVPARALHATPGPGHHTGSAQRRGEAAHLSRATDPLSIGARGWVSGHPRQGQPAWPAAWGGPRTPNTAASIHGSPPARSPSRHLLPVPSGEQDPPF